MPFDSGHAYDWLDGLMQDYKVKMRPNGGRKLAAQDLKQLYLRERTKDRKVVHLRRSPASLKPDHFQG